MSWTKLAPIVKTSGRPMASASIAVNKDGSAKVSLILSAFLRDEFGDLDKVDVLAGSGEHADCVRLEFRADGAFEVKNFAHGGGRLFFPVPGGIPVRISAGFGCSLVEKDMGAEGEVKPDGWSPSVILKLPVADWTRAARPPSGGSAVQPKAAPPPAAPKDDDKRLDVAEYLTTKGRRCSRLAGGRFMLSGETVTMGQVLKAVNDCRHEAGLTPLSHAEVR